jgi:hypothetical protein
LFQIVSQKHKADYFEGVDLNLFPHVLKGTCLGLLHEGLEMQSYGAAKKSFETFDSLFDMVSDNPLELHDNALNLAIYGAFSVAAKFYKRYFALKPFDK